MNKPGRPAIGFALVAALALSAPAASAAATIALKGARVHTAAGPAIDNAVLLIENGRIAAVGSDVPIPPGTEVLDVAGMTVIPGMIDAYSHLGMTASGLAADLPRAAGPEQRAVDGLHLNIPDWMEAVRAGVTTVVTGPGFDSLAGGQTVTLKTFGPDFEKRVLKEAGEVILSVSGASLSQIPSLRARLIAAREYKEKREKAAAEGKNPASDRDLGLESLAAALNGRETIRARALWAHDILSLLELKDEFGLDLQLIDAPEAWKVAGEIASRNVGVVCPPMVLHTSYPEEVFRGAGVLQRAGVRTARRSDFPLSPQKHFRLNAAMSVRYGLTADQALKAVTLDAARLARIDGRVGSLEPGKDADVVVLNGSWFEPSSRVEMVFVDGALAFRRADDPSAPAGKGGLK